MAGIGFNVADCVGSVGAIYSIVMPSFTKGKQATIVAN